MADEQFGELAAMRRIDRIKALSDAAALIRAHTGKFIAKELRQVAKRGCCRFLEFLEEALFVKSYAANKNLWLTDPRWPAKNDNNKGDFKDMRDKSKSALSQVTPQARYHYTRFDQVDQLVGAGESDSEIGYMGRLLALCNLPRTSLGDRKEYIRSNGPYELSIIAGSRNKLPYGNIPRLLLAWVCTEAVRTKNRRLFLGESLSKFVQMVGIAEGGGARTRLREQMERLFRCQISLIYRDAQGSSSVSSLIADVTEFWWNRNPAGVLWQSNIELGEKFFNEVIHHAVPLDMNILKALTRSSLGLDLYQWLNYRTFALEEPLRLSWRQLYRQFGADPARACDKYPVDDFRKDCLRELKRITVAWAGLDYATPKGALVLLPTTTPSVPPLQFPLLPR